MKLPEALVNLFFPPKCPFCGKLLEKGELLCPGCQRDLPWLEIVSAYRYDDLAPLASAARQAEAEVRRAVREGGAVLRDYTSFEQFAQAEKERGC